MGIMTRIIRLCKADMHGVVDNLEDKELLLKQHLRDMEEAIKKKEYRLLKLKSTRESANKKIELFSGEKNKTEQDMLIALGKNKDDIAKMLIKKIKMLESHINSVSIQIESIEVEIIELKDVVTRQRIEYEQLEIRSKTYFQVNNNEMHKINLQETAFDNVFQEPSAEEIELELIKRKEAFKGGA